jgi:hypothetical protein
MATARMPIASSQFLSPVPALCHPRNMQRQNYVPRCDGCGNTPSDAHVRRRIERLELATRYRPIHIQTLFLALAPPEPMEDFFYNVAPPAAERSTGAKQFLGAVMAQAGIGGAFSGDAAALAEFQRHNSYLAYVLECPVAEVYPEREAADSGIAAAIARDHGAALLRRIQFSYRPKRIEMIEPGIPELMETLRQTGLDVLGNAGGSARPAAV